MVINSDNDIIMDNFSDVVSNTNLSNHILTEMLKKDNIWNKNFIFNYCKYSKDLGQW